MSLSETMMLVLLGFVLGLILVMLLARIAWNLALRAAARHQAAAVPATILDLKAERDRLRAEHAMMAQKLDTRLEQSRLRMAEHMAEVTRSRNRIELLAQDLAQRDKTLAEREAELAALRSELAARQADITSQAMVIEQITRQSSAKDEELVRRAAEIARLTQFRTTISASLGADDGLATLPDAPAEAPEVRIQRRIAELSALSHQMSADHGQPQPLASGAAWVKEPGAAPAHVALEPLTAETIFGHAAANDSASESAPHDFDGIPTPGAKPEPLAPGDAPRHNREGLARRIRAIQGNNKS
jgi:hypothetical protein